MIKMRDGCHADISNGFNVRVYSTEPPEDRPKGLSLFYALFYKDFKKILKFLPTQRDKK